MPATLSPVMGAILRNDLKFPGMIVTDALSMSGLTIYFTQEEAAVRALEAGADMLLKPADVDASFRGVLQCGEEWTHYGTARGRVRPQDTRRQIRSGTAWTSASRRSTQSIASSAVKTCGHWRLRLRNTPSRSFVMKTSWCH